VIGEPAQRPGGGARLLLLLTTAIGFFGVFSLGFPPASPDRLPVLLLALALALLSAWSPVRGLLAFSFLFPLAGAGDRLFGGADPIAWPVLLFAGFAAGWTFRFLYDFESAPDPSSADATLRTLTAIWCLSALLAAVRARTLWALFRGLSLRAVNGEGLLDAAAIHDSVVSLAVLATGVGYFFILRRSGSAARARALWAALAGIAASAGVAVGQRLGLAPPETSGFWRMTGRLSGGAVDPNALGLLCGLGLVVGIARLTLDSGRRLPWAGATLLLTAGLVLSGSRSGLLVAGLGLVAWIAASERSGRRRLAFSAIVAALLVAGAVAALRGSPGSTGSRLYQMLDETVSVEHRVSARPLLWESAIRLFRRHPVAGAGLGAFSWQLPDLLAERGRSLPMRDNPGNAYLQALAETGAIGFLLTVALALALVPSVRSGRGGAGAAVAAFLVALLTGSHWFAPDVALFFFLLAAVAAPPAVAPGPAWRARLRGALVAIYAIAVVWAGLSTLRADAAFRFRAGIGFHAKEVGRGGDFYWTERRFAIRLPAGEDMRMDLAHFTPEGRDAELTAEAAGRVVYRRTLSPGQAVRLRLRGPSAGASVIRFTVSRSFIPKRLGLSPDRRELGLVAVFPKAD
jgi:O-antigen ligase